ncbi:DUF4190 domain-containing protein [Catellatospora bangladeshensis]|uniref:DUF4190 domain-containing protein n=1 Tax=Catellatospora bangladeshensis TaxID=310355 RepID=A0A8J3JXD9_9ACTN|nr:DUF4190 domain-containing protein [Catellatospora bangladeshensis]GIF84849.1 hypothetical protein Cba03nite_61980 [Catellatospora bangladeshensis]
MTDQTPPPVPPQYPPYQQPPQYNTYAILALVLAIFVLPPLGIYFGGKAKQQIAVTGERGVEFATAAVVIGWVLTGLFIAMIALWCAMAGIFAGGATIGM